ncbi:uncharacterized protein Dana_GF27960 [Drosophila ananassae]|uniref:C-type lectin domain-containing protein n=1 Tax=Drosophila ananassae TaxID=7217 RepID=A0A0P9A790_DROAN|nr:uncharacterized protein Dana_GF27960 [Drosophila ananassae]
MFSKYIRLAAVVGVLISFLEAADLSAKVTSPSTPGTPVTAITSAGIEPEEIGVQDYYIERAWMRNWFDAFQTCRARGMHLMYFTSVKEWRELDEYLWDHNIDDVYWTSGTTLAQNYNQNNSRKFYWFSNGKPIIHNLWAHGEPNNLDGNENCVEMGYKRQSSSAHRLNDQSCYTKRRYICRKYKYIDTARTSNAKIRSRIKRP